MTTQVINHKIILYTDSMYIVNSIEKWAIKWEKNDWKKSDGSTILNVELIKRLYYLSKNLKVTFTHINSHTKEPPKDSPNYYKWYGNYMADKLASEAAI
jgi:ribonuclease HI